jgi:hypothetical protein
VSAQWEDVFGDRINAVPNAILIRAATTATCLDHHPRAVELPIDHLAVAASGPDLVVAR